MRAAKVWGRRAATYSNDMEKGETWGLEWVLIPNNSDGQGRRGLGVGDSNFQGRARKSAKEKLSRRRLLWGYSGGKGGAPTRLGQEGRLGETWGIGGGSQPCKK